MELTYIILGISVVANMILSYVVMVFIPKWKAYTKAVERRREIHNKVCDFRDNLLKQLSEASSFNKQVVYDSIGTNLFDLAYSIWVQKSDIAMKAYTSVDFELCIANHDALDAIYNPVMTEAITWRFDDAFVQEVKNRKLIRSSFTQPIDNVH